MSEKNVAFLRSMVPARLLGVAKISWRLGVFATLFPGIFFCCLTIVAGYSFRYAEHHSASGLGDPAATVRCTHPVAFRTRSSACRRNSVR
jgi:hypothetical protein